MRFGKPDVQGHEPRLGAKANQREQEGNGRPVRREMCTAHRVEGELPTPTLHDPEAQENRDRPDMRDQQVEEARTADLGDAVLRGHEEVGRQRHGFPRDHERVRIIRQQHETHAGEEQVVLQAHQARGGSLAAAEVAGRKDRNSRRGGSEQKEKEARERIAPHVHRQVGQSEWQDRLLRRRRKAHHGHYAPGPRHRGRPAERAFARRSAGSSGAANLRAR